MCTAWAWPRTSHRTVLFLAERTALTAMASDFGRMMKPQTPYPSLNPPGIFGDSRNCSVEIPESQHDMPTEAYRKIENRACTLSINL